VRLTCIRWRRWTWSWNEQTNSVAKHCEKVTREKVMHHNNISLWICHRLQRMLITSDMAHVASKRYAPPDKLFRSFPVTRQYRRPRLIRGSLSLHVHFSSNNASISLYFRHADDVFFGFKDVSATAGNGIHKALFSCWLVGLIPARGFIFVYYNNHSSTTQF